MADANGGKLGTALDRWKIADKEGTCDVELGGSAWTSVVAQLFGVEPDQVVATDKAVQIAGTTYQVERGVVLLTDQVVRYDTKPGTGEDVRRSFSQEWEAYREILNEHESEFAAYFDLIDMESVRNSVVMDLGCGSGRWSAKLAPHCKVVVLVDFSDAIFVAQENLAESENAVFFRADVTALPFAENSIDLLYSLGVLHHLDQPCLPVARDLMRLGPRGLFYLYYALDNRPVYYRYLLSIVTAARRGLVHVKSESSRRRISRSLALGVYRPMVAVGNLAQRLGVRTPVPLYSSYTGKSIRRIEQDAYDRFFTSIEQRVTQDQIRAAMPPDWQIRFSEEEPFWHFLVERPGQALLSTSATP